ncbi:MAG TPA: CPBP family intramembrane glutamic endopeptidase [Roseiflexaceae bacterium]|nr:CPBP family intramembrane glutamic endopeptidase [Roseiflexaceae bacterium]
MTALISFIRRQPLLTFFVLAFAFSWWGWPLYAAQMSPVPIFSPGPCIAAFVVTALTAGRLGVRDLIHRMLRWRVGLRWYAVALALPALIAATATLFNTLFGATPRWPAQIDGWTDLALTFALNLLVPAFGGAWEEPGWRGFALPHLQVSRSPLRASLLLSVVGVLWHLPLFLSGDIQYPDIVLIPGVYIVLAWIYNRTGSSILLVMLTHAANNTISGDFFSQMFSGADAVRQAWLVAVAWGIVAFLVVRLIDPSLAERPAAQTKPVAAGQPAV